MRKPQGVASLALGYVLHWAFSPPLLNQKLELSIRFMVVNTIWFSTKVKCCKGNTKTLHPSKKSVQFVHKYLFPPRLPTCKRECVLLLPSYTICA